MKRKIVIYSLIIVTLLCFTAAGVVSAIMKDNYKNNNIIFQVNDQKAYCNIVGHYYYNNVEVTDSNYRAYNQSYLEGNDYSDNGFDGFDPWVLPDAKFTGEGTEVYKFEIVITNYNKDYSLSAELRNVAVSDKDSDDQFLFYTTITYKLGNGEDVVKFSNKEGIETNLSSYKGNNIINLEKEEIPKANNDSKLKITIEIERKTKVKPINSNNNFSIVLDSVEPQQN